MRRRFVVATWFMPVLLIIAGQALAQKADEAELLHQKAMQLFREGKYAEATPLSKRVLAIREKKLGSEHPEVAPALNYLAALYAAQGFYDDAEPLFKRSLALREKALGPAHPSVAIALESLAGLYQDQGRYGEAEPLFKRTLSVREQSLGPEHPYVAAALIRLAGLYHSQGRYGEAEPLYQRSLAIRERALGPEHPDFARSLHDLAALYQVQARYSEAEPLLKRSVSIFEQTLGAEHPNVAATLNNLAELYRALGRYGESEPLLKRSLDIVEKSLGPDHPKVANALTNLGALYRAQGRYGESELLLRRGLAIREQALGPEHPLVGQSVINLADLFTSQDRHSEPEALYKRALAIRELALGSEHPDVALTLNNLADLYRAQRRYGEAEPLFKRSLAIDEKALGQAHISVAINLNNLAWVALGQNDLAGAADYWRRATALLQRRAERGLGGTPGGSLKGEAQKNFWYFEGLVKTTHRLASEDSGAAKARAAEMFESAQWGFGSEAAASLAQMSARSAGGSPQLAALVRERQDLVAEWQGKDKLLVAAKSEAPERRSATGEKELSDRLAAIDGRFGEIDARFAKDFPDYAALASPRPISVADAQASLREGEALVLFLDTDDQFKPLPEETFIWVVTKTDMKWVRSDLGTGALQREVTALRCGLDASAWADPAKWSEATDEDRQRKLAQQARRDACIKATGVTVSDDALPPFDAARAHALYKGLFGEVEDLIRGKHLLVVPSGPLTQLPLQVLVTEPPAPDTALKDIAWLGARQPITVLPSAASLKSLRRDAKPSRASEPFIGFGNPVLAGNQNCGKIIIPDRCPNDPAPAAEAASRMLGRLVASLNTVTAYFTRSGQADVESVRKLCPLPDSAHELSCVAKSLGAGADSMVIGPAMTEPAVRRAKLDRYRVLHFATHGLLAGEMSAMAKGKAEPALVFTPPKAASDDDDGLLTASEITTLKLDADWVVMSACNTAAGGASGAEALSGLAKAFFYAGARALLVSHWPVNSYAATMLTSTTFAELKRDPKIGRAEAFRRAMVALIKDDDRSWAAHPSVWAPFVVVGEGGAG